MADYTQEMPELLRGDLLKIIWVDILEDSVGNPDRASLAKRTSYGLLWETKRDKGINCLVTTTTIDAEEHTQSGYCIYPLSCLLDISIIKKVRRPRKKLSNGPDDPKPHDKEKSSPHDTNK